MEKDLSTEQKIKDAARKVFMTKGFSGCTTREIAKSVGINVALLNYYFRSKGKLFELILEAALSDFIDSMVEVFHQDLSLEEKTRMLIDKEFEFLRKHPELPLFIHAGLNQSSDNELDQSNFLGRLHKTGIFEQCEQAQREGKMRKVNMINVTLLFMSNCHFPIMSKKLVCGIYQMSDQEHEDRLNEHQEIVKEMLINYLFPNTTKNA
ncbi:MAG: TetR/AcrR family transcriptional regulator [Crocinitomicaceae bacterium]|jgi:AcrR family transcriptional regulator